MPKFVTPARLAAAVGVVSGLGAAATALAGALPVSPTQAAIVGAAGILGQAGVIFKFLEGQSNWETAQVHAAVLTAAPAIVEGVLPAPEVAVLGDGDEPIVPDTPEPERLTAQL